MSRSICVLAALLFAYSALAAPAPEPFAGGWGNPVDPDRDCKIRRHKGVLTFEIHGTVHDYDPVHKRLNAPRLLRDIEGDFEIQVRVRIDCRPSARSTVKSQPSCVSAGFLLIYSETGRFFCDRFEYGISQQAIGLDGYAVKPFLPAWQLDVRSRKGIGEDGYAVMKSWDSNKQRIDKTWDRESPRLYHILWDRGWAGWPLGPMPKETDCAYLRLDLEKRSFNFFISADGKKWTELVKHSGPPAKLKLGLAAYSTSSELSKVRFDHLKITRGKKKSK